MTHERLHAVTAADHVVGLDAAIAARRQKSAEHAVVGVPGLHHEPFERRGPVDRAERHVDQSAGHDGHRVYQQPVRARLVLEVLRRVARVTRPHVLARDLQHFVGDRVGARARRPQRRHDRGHGDQRPYVRHVITLQGGNALDVPESCINTRHFFFFINNC